MSEFQNDPDKVRVFERTVTSIFDQHIAKLESLHSPEIMALVEPVKHAYAQNALLTADRVLQAYKDSQPRYWSTISKEFQLLLTVSVIPRSLKERRSYFEERCPSAGYGYSHALNQILNSSEARAAAGEGVRTLAHLIFWCDLGAKSLCVDLSIVPLLEELAASAAGAVLATDLLTELEKTRFGV